jgi:hypothetical protein
VCQACMGFGDGSMDPVRHLPGDRAGFRTGSGCGVLASLEANREGA